MSEINILPSEIFNRIAAGEVIENPSSIVKELVENSIDAGATEVSITVSDGGRHINVADNGASIAPSDLPTAFMPHATSKISTINDLDSIKTLGFRGEALPSIASVARVTAVSRKSGADFGSKLLIENGKVLEHSEVGAPFGTSITVQDLFKNVPARLKFLKTDRTEEGNISTLISKFIIANFNVAISLTINGKEIYRSYGNGVEESIFSVYGNNFLKEMSYIESIMPDIDLFGYVNKPNYSKHNRSYQTLVVNGRYVNNADVSFWVYNCFSSVLMKRQYPAYIIYINLPYDMVDINVHPNKMDVKFVGFDRIKRMLSNAIGSALNADAMQPKELELVADTSIQVDAKKDAVDFEKKGNLFDDISFASSKNSFTDFMQFTEPAPTATNRLISESILPEKEKVYSVSPSNETFLDSLPTYKKAGKLFNTYLMIEQHDDVILIDQHAAHERILFDRFSKALDDGTNSTQSMLVPYIFDLSVSEAALLDDALPEICSLGFGISRLSGNSFSLSEMPLVFSDIDMNEFTAQLVKALMTGHTNKANFIKDAVAQTACKAAIKGEMDLNDADVKLLIEQIAASKIQLFCPHGRPIAVRLTRNEIEKWFKRIV